MKFDRDIFETTDDTNEFHFEDDDAVTALPEIEQKPSSLVERLKEILVKNKIYLAIAAIIVVIFIYEMVSLFSSPKTNTSNPENTQFTQVVNPTERQNSQGTIVEPQQANFSNGAVKTQTNNWQQPSPNINDINLQSEQSNLNDRIAALEKETGVFQQQIADLQQQNANLINGLSSITLAVNQINVNLQTLGKKEQQLSTASQDKTIVNGQNQYYYVEAVIPGRAWLKAADGTTLTVSPGEVVPKYGRVTSINPDNGTVATTSGKIIHYGINEN